MATTGSGLQVDPAALRRELAARRARRWPLARFVREAWPTMQPGRELVWEPHLDAVCEHLEAVTDGRVRQLCINIPPRHMKSLLTRIAWVAWWWVRDPTLRVLAATHSHRLTEEHSVGLRDLVTSEWYQRTFRPPWGLRSDRNAIDRFVTTEGGFCASVSVGSKTTGHGGDLILLDDLLSRDDAHSESHRKRANDYFRKTMATRLNDPRTGRQVMIAQRLHEDDPPAHALELGWESLVLPSRYEPERHCSTSIGWEDWRREPGELLCPNRFGEAELAALEVSLGSDEFAAQHQHRPTPATGAIILREWTAEDRRYDRLPMECTTRGVWTQTWDLKAGSKDPRSSWVVGQAWCQVGADRYLVDQVRARWDIEETMAELEAFRQRWPMARRTLIENKADGRAVVTMLSRRLDSIVLCNPGDRDKASRLRATRPLWEAGNVHLPVEFPSACQDNTVEGYVAELTSVPNHPYDDQADATSQYLLDAIEDWTPTTAPAVTPARRKPRASLGRLRRLSGRR